MSLAANTPKALVMLLLALPAAAADNNLSKGPCSPIVVANTGSVAITCVDVPSQLAPQFADVLSRIMRSQSDPTLILERLDELSRTLALAKLETSPDPRKEIANNGMTWSAESLGNVSALGDLKFVNLFFSGAMPAGALDDSGEFVVVRAIRENHDNIGLILRAFVNNGLSLNSVTPRSVRINQSKLDTLSPDTNSGFGSVKLVAVGEVLLRAAVENFNAAAVKALIEMGVSKDSVTSELRSKSDSIKNTLHAIGNQPHKDLECDIVEVYDWCITNPSCRTNLAPSCSLTDLDSASDQCVVETINNFRRNSQRIADSILQFHRTCLQQEPVIRRQLMLQSEDLRDSLANLKKMKEILGS